MKALIPLTFGLLFFSVESLFGQFETLRPRESLAPRDMTSELLSFPDSQALPLEPDYFTSWLWTIPDVDHPLVDHYENLYRTTRKSVIARSLERAEIFKELIFQVLDEFNAPRELFFLPIIESAFASTATSRVGAAGLWQFMPRSATPYEMTITTWLDERRDFLKSTRGAIKKLMDEYAILGDWHLTLAAYNCGVARVQRVLRQHGPLTFWEMAERRLLPRETIHYVPSFLAAVRVASRAGRLDLPVSWEPSSGWTLVRVPFQADLKLLAQAAGVDYQRLRSYNRELIYGITPETGHDLKVPLEWEEAIRKALDDPQLSQLRFRIHQVKPGETLGHLARMYHIPIGLIQKYNGNIHPARLRINQRLVIPILNSPEYPLPRDPRTSPPVSGPIPEPGQRYVVRSGDTLWSLARRWRTTVERIQSVNQLGSSVTIRAGQILIRP